VQVRGICRSFGPLRVLDDVTLDVRAGEMVALTGPNGSGKTTLLRILAGTTAPDRGSALIYGHAAGTRAARDRTGVGFALDGSFFEPLTAAENLLVFAQLRLGRRAARAAVAGVAAELELGRFADRAMRGFSAGMRGQVAFARALLGEPSVLLLDEPTRSLDAGATARLWRALERRPHAAILIASHRSEDLARCARAHALGVA
jgi:ABC-2 type transport system ATP-binding protein